LILLGLLASRALAAAMKVSLYKCAGCRLMAARKWWNLGLDFAREFHAATH